MPAETHQRSESVTIAEVADLLRGVLGIPTGSLEAEDSLAELGFGDDLVRFDLWDVAVEEYGERTIGEVDLDQLRGAATLTDLAALIVDHCVVDDNGGIDRGDLP